jgi:peptidoglycan/LPS O-acetylase OafA/YrhL
VLAMHFGPRLVPHLPSMPRLERLGRQSLPVFVAHVVLAMLVLAGLGAIDPQRPWLIDAALLTACFAILYAVALASEAVDARAARARERWRNRLSERRAARALRRAPRGDATLPASTAHSPPR